MQTNTSPSTQYVDAWHQALPSVPKRRIFDIIRTGRFNDENLESMRTKIAADCSDAQITLINSSIQDGVNETDIARIFKRYI